MEGATYRPVLPDDSASVNLGLDTQRHAHVDFVRQPPIPKHSSNSRAQPPMGKKAAVQPIPVKLSNNKVLTIGLLVIVVILIIVIVIQIIRHRRTCEEEEASMQSSSRNIIPEQPTQPIQQNVSQRREEHVDNATLQEYMKKKKPAAAHGRRRSAMSAYSQGKNKKDDVERLKIIVEDGTEQEDPEYSDMRKNINALLHEQKADADEAMGTGSKNIISAENIANETRTEQQTVYYPKVADEALIDQRVVMIEVASGDEETADGGDNDEYAGDDEEAAGVCTSILVSGKRSGQQCGRKCGDAKSRCARHKNK